MPGRLIPLVNEEVYHVFNRGIDHRPTFINKRDFERVKKLLNFYQFYDLPLRYSVFLFLADERKKELLALIKKTGKNLVQILAYCFMPNHFHFLLRQKAEKGISKFMSNFQNSYTRYFNTKYKRIGPLFLDQFKAVRVETDEQLLHLSRYIHLNPYAGLVIKSPEELKTYPWSSLPEYLGLQREKISTPSEILAYFKHRSSFEKFIFERADYQRNLEKIKHLVFENLRFIP